MIQFFRNGEKHGVNTNSSTFWTGNRFLGSWFNVKPCIVCVTLVYSSRPSVLSMNSPLSHPPPSPHVSDVCVFGIESGLPACSHMLFYPSVASGAVGRLPSLPPPPASLSVFGWPSLFLTTPSFFLLLCPVSSLLSLAVHLLLGLCLSRGEEWSLSSLLSRSLIPPSAFRDRWKGGVSVRELRRPETKWATPLPPRQFLYCQWEEQSFVFIIL